MLTYTLSTAFLSRGTSTRRSTGRPSRAARVSLGSRRCTGTAAGDEGGRLTVDERDEAAGLARVVAGAADPALGRLEPEAGVGHGRQGQERLGERRAVDELDRVDRRRARRGRHARAGHAGLCVGRKAGSDESTGRRAPHLGARGDRRTFLQTNETDGLWTAYLVTTSTTRANSSETLRSARLRDGTLKKRSSTCGRGAGGLVSMARGGGTAWEGRERTVMVVPLLPAADRGSTDSPGLGGTRTPSE